MTTAIENLRSAGQVLWFEYHCYEGHDSVDAELWYRSHQQITVLSVAENDGMDIPSYEERCELGHPIMYKIRFADGFEGEAFEDELMNSKDEFCRPDPPEKPSTVTEKSSP